MNMQRYLRFTVSTAAGMAYMVARPLYDLLKCARARPPCGWGGPGAPLAPPPASEGAAGGGVLAASQASPEHQPSAPARTLCAD